MAYEEGLRSRTYEADADLRERQYRFVKDVDDSGGTAISPSVRVNACDTAGERALGVLQNKPAAQGHAATVAREGTSKVVFGAACGRGDDVTTDAEGRAIPAAAGNAVLGTCQLAVAAAGQIGSVELHLQGRPNAA